MIFLLQLYLVVTYAQAAIVAMIFCDVMTTDETLPAQPLQQLRLAATLAAVAMIWGLVWPVTLVSAVLVATEHGGDG